MTRVLLTTPPEPLFSPFYTSEKAIPIGLAYLAEVLQRAGHRVDVFDNYLEPTALWNSPGLRFEEIDIVGIHANTICADGVARIASFFQHLREKKLFRGRIAIGGPMTSVSRNQFPSWIDHVVEGEGEAAVSKIADGESARHLRDYSTGSKTLDDLPLPGFENFLHLPYSWSSSWLPGRRVINLNTSRGCPFNCSFCSVQCIWGKRYRALSPSRIMEWIHLVKSKGFDGVYFREDNFTLNRKRTIGFCEAMLRENVPVEWICESRVDSLDEATIALMSRAGCKAIYVGVEAGSDESLAYLKKGETTGQFSRAFGWFRRHGIRTYASFIIGYPGSTPEDDQRAVEFGQKLKADYLGYNVFVGVPFSELYHEALARNLVDFRDYRGLLYLQGHNRRVLKHYGIRALWRLGLNPLVRAHSAWQQHLGWSPQARTSVESWVQALSRQLPSNVSLASRIKSKLTRGVNVISRQG